MPKKTIFTDIESTGLNCKVHSIVQLAIIVDIDKVVVDELNLEIKPFNNFYEKDALKVNGLSWEDIQKFEDHNIAYKKIIDILEKHMPYEERGMYDNRDKFNICAYNAEFDISFLSEFFKRNGDNRFWRFFNRVLDPFKQLETERLLAKTVGYAYHQKSLKLTALGERLGIELDGEAHNALVDTRCLRELVYKLGDIYKVFNFDIADELSRLKKIEKKYNKLLKDMDK